MNGGRLPRAEAIILHRWTCLYGTGVFILKMSEVIQDILIIYTYNYWGMHVYPNKSFWHKGN